jgi:hypothetical protein
LACQNQSIYTIILRPIRVAIRPKQGVARKYSVLTEIIDIFAQACKVCINDEDVAETDFEHTFETPKGFRPGFGKPCAAPAAGHLETS